MESTEQNKLMNKIERDMGMWNRLQISEGNGEGNWIKEGEKISQRTYMHDP